MLTRWGSVGTCSEWDVQGVVVLLVDKWAARRLRRCKGVGGMQQRGGRRERGRVERPRSLTSGLVMSPRSGLRQLHGHPAPTAVPRGMIALQRVPYMASSSILVLRRGSVWPLWFSSLV